MSSLQVRSFILIKRIRIVLDVLEIKKKDILVDFVDKCLIVIEKIHNYSLHEELSDEMLDYCYHGLSFLERIINLMDNLHFELLFNNKNNYIECIHMLNDLSLKF